MAQSLRLVATLLQRVLLHKHMSPFRVNPDFAVHKLKMRRSTTSLQLELVRIVWNVSLLADWLYIPKRTRFIDYRHRFDMVFHSSHIYHRKEWIYGTFRNESPDISIKRTAILPGPRESLALLLLTMDVVRFICKSSTVKRYYTFLNTQRSCPLVWSYFAEETSFDSRCPWAPL